MKKIIWLALWLPMLFSACRPKENTKSPIPPEGIWRAEIRLKGAWLPFNFNLSYSDGSPLMSIKNGEELIEVQDLVMTSDSLIIRMPVFHSEIHLSVANDTMRGEWWYLSKGRDYRLPFRAVYGADYRFFPEADLQSPVRDISGKWKTIFNPGDPDREELAMGIFDQEGNKLKGTFDASTGDYRYLEGVVSGDSLYLSEFDGAFAYLFKAKIGDTIRGILYSGRSGVYPWIAFRDEAFTLPDPESMTRLKPGEERILHTFSDLEGQPVSLSDERFRGKVLVVEVMGTWCSNCKDEAKLLTRLYEKYKDKGLEVVSLAYERSGDLDKERENILRMRDHLGLPYTILFAGKIGEAEAQLPIDRLYSYPTTFFIDRSGRIREIHSGFSGPATGEAYERTMQKFNEIIQNLLEE